MGEFK